MAVRKKKARRLGIVACATAGGVGYFPVAPGTLGTLVGMWCVSWLPFFDTWFGLVWIGAVLAVAIWSSGQAFQGKDAPQIVIDEVVGFMITMWCIPKSAVLWILGFLAFRAFDILKPFPIREVERRLPKGWGIVLDDCLAGVFAHGVLHWVVLSELGRL